MPILKKYLFFFVLLTLFQTARSQETSTVDETVNLRNEVLRLYSQKKYDEALETARRIVRIKEEKFGSQHIEVAKALGDVGTIEIASGNLTEGEKTARRAIAVFETKRDLTSDEVLAFARMFEAVGLVKYRGKKPEEAIPEYLRALELKEKHSGRQSLEASKTLWHIGNVYLGLSKYQESFEAFERVVKIRSEYMEQLGFDEVFDAVRRYECVANKSNNGKKAKPLINAADDKANKYYKQTVVDSGIVNGKALVLGAPSYSGVARALRLSGRVKVQVTIDETGRVIFACAKDGSALLYESAEKAALKSRFEPTLMNGKPVKVIGEIVYNFR